LASFVGFQGGVQLVSGRGWLIGGWNPHPRKQRQAEAAVVVIATYSANAPHHGSRPPGPAVSGRVFAGEQV
jgi:hypothetical protein